jgi:hypothetical protein
VALLHTHQFYSNRIGTTTATVLYTVPTGDKITVKFMQLANFSGTTHQPIITVNGVYILAAPNLTNGQVFQWNGWAVLNAGDQLKYSCSSAAATDINISGYLYFV